MKVDPLKLRLRKFAGLSLPLVVSFLMMTIQEQINVIFIGHLGDPAILSGIGVGNMVMNLVPYAIMIGINTALETLVSQAYGRQNLPECGLYLHRAVFLILCLFVPIAVSFFWVGDFLVLVGIEPEIAAHTHTYITMLLPTVLLNPLGDSIDLFLISMGFNNVVCLLQLVVIPVHLLTCWLFVCRFELGIAGAAFSNNLTALITISCQIIYVSRLEKVKDAWYWPTGKTFQNLGPFMRLAMPGILMLLLENFSMEVLVLLAGLLQNVEMFAAQVILVAIGQFVIMIPYGLSLAAVSMVGHSLGANKPAQAQANYKMIVLASGALCLLVAIVLSLSSGALISLFTADEEVQRLAEASFGVFVVAFAFDWSQCCISGLIKGAGFQGIGSICSLLCLLIVAMPSECILAHRHEWGISGLWAGYGASALLLTILYLLILSCVIDWKETAQKAAESDEFSVSSSEGNSSNSQEIISTNEESQKFQQESSDGFELNCTLFYSSQESAGDQSFAASESDCYVRATNI